MVLWSIQESRSVAKSLQYYKTDKAVSNNYDRFVDELLHFEDLQTWESQKKASTRVVLARTLQNLSLSFIASTTQCTELIC